MPYTHRRVNAFQALEESSVRSRISQSRIIKRGGRAALNSHLDYVRFGERRLQSEKFATKRYEACLFIREPRKRECTGIRYQEI